MKAVRRAAVAVVVGAGLLAAVAAAEAEGWPVQAPAGQEQATAQQGATQPVVVRSTHVELSVDPRTGRVDVVDLRSGARWSSTPDLPQGVRITGLWRAHMDAGFILEYAEADRRPKGMLNPSRFTLVRNVRPIDAGVAVDFELASASGDREFAFTMEWTVGEDYVELRIPFDSVYERPGGMKLVSLRPVPFFGAGTDSDQGYVLFPDGPGAISRFKADHPSYSSNFREGVYQWGTEYRAGGGQVRLPVFGIKKGNAALVAFITRGDTEAEVEFSPSGYVLPLSRAAAVLYFRHRFTVALRRNAFVEKVDEALIPGDRVVRYVFLAGDDADYSGMARAYRRWLLEAGWLRRAIPDDFAGYLDLSLFMGIEKPMVLGRSFVTMTTFEQAQQILEDLRRRGVERVELTLMGWNARGFMGSPPERLPPEPHLGGAEGLRRLSAYAREHGVGLWLYDQFVWVARGARGYSARSDVVRKATREPVGFSRLLSLVPALTREQEYLMLSPYAALRVAARDVPAMASFGITGIVDENLASLLYRDYNPGRPMSRREFAEAMRELAEVYRKNGLKVGAMNGNAYMLAQIDRLWNVPMESSQFLFADETVPFFQMVVHGYVPYSGETHEAGNLRADPARMKLRTIEFGALPRYVLTAEDTAKLADTWFSSLYSSRYDDWADAAVEEYREMVGKLGFLQAIPIHSHRRLDDGVYEVLYEDQSRVVVNYRESPLTLPDGTVVPPLGYTLSVGRGSVQP